MNLKQFFFYFQVCAWTIMLSAYAHPSSAQNKFNTLDADICIYGSTSAGVIAAYTAAKAGKKVILIDPGHRLGGMSSGGLGQTDIGNKYVVKGLALDFYRKVGQHYGKFERWIFEPHVADSIFQAYMRACPSTILFDHVLTSVDKKDRRITSIHLRKTTDNKKATSVHAKEFIDCSYEGDLMAMSGVSYAVGRENNSQYQETINGVQLMTKHQFPDGIDPYNVPGDSSSGLVWGISKNTLLPNGTGDKKVQAYNFRLTLTNVPENRIPIEKPDNYDPTHYELLKRLKEKSPWKQLSDVFGWSIMPNGKTDINNSGGFSTDMIGMNWDYPNAGYEQRQQIIKAHEDYTKGLLYFLGHDPAVPGAIREEMLQWGYPRDEYQDNHHWTPQLYIREARRMIGELVMTQHHCQGSEVVTDDVGYAAYTMDSHNCDRLVVNGMVKNEGDVQVGGFPPFPIAYRAIIPQRTEVGNLLVPVCLSATHIAYGSIRMEPVFMVLGQSAAIAACLAIKHRKSVQDVSPDAIKAQLRQNPKGDGRTADVWIDSRDSTQVSYTGTWKEVKQGGYGSAFRVSSDVASFSSARFTPKGLAAGKYSIYSYYPKLKAGSSKMEYVLSDGKIRTRKEIDLHQVHIEGQTSGDWLYIGDMNVDANTQSFVEITNSGADGAVAANAVLFVPKIK
ncbi:FAD dependent oxidoreductase [bacterium A37T11]|nr:FAD dependent oxidoreductase [bacterium A37T11]